MRVLWTLTSRTSSARILTFRCLIGLLSRLRMNILTNRQCGMPGRCMRVELHSYKWILRRSNKPWTLRMLHRSVCCYKPWDGESYIWEESIPRGRRYWFAQRMIYWGPTTPIEADFWEGCYIGNLESFGRLCSSSTPLPVTMKAVPTCATILSSRASSKWCWRRKTTLMFANCCLPLSKKYLWGDRHFCAWSTTGWWSGRSIQSKYKNRLCLPSVFSTSSPCL